MVNGVEDKRPNKESKIDRYILELVISSLEGNTTKAELLSLSLSRLIMKENPKLARNIQEALGQYTLRGSAGLRGASTQPIPVDADTQLEMATIVSPKVEADNFPVLLPIIKERIENFLAEQRNVQALFHQGIKPSNSLLLVGQPGTGKTLLAHYIASALDKRLIVLDLSASISSLLGKTGHNLKKVLQYAKQTPCVLLLDEFDAIAKKRDDNTDLGEIKRVVNVLLMELEDWPSSSILIATSNHPELLDKAIWRRFDHTIEIPLPGITEIAELLEKHLGKASQEGNTFSRLFPVLSEVLKGRSPADICRFMNNVKRRAVLKNEDVPIAAIQELEVFTADKKVRGNVCIYAKNELKMTVRDISKLTGLSVAGVQHHLSKA